MSLEDLDRQIWSPEGKNACWLWTGWKDGKGYGRTTHEGKKWIVHRLVYTLFKGDIPDGMQLDHLCHNTDKHCPGGRQCYHRACCNPAHLEPVTNLQNVYRSPKHNQAKTHCKQGHPFTQENTGINKHKGTERRYCRTCQRAWNRAAAAKRRARELESVA